MIITTEGDMLVVTLAADDPEPDPHQLVLAHQAAGHEVSMCLVRRPHKGASWSRELRARHGGTWWVRHEQTEGRVSPEDADREVRRLRTERRRRVAQAKAERACRGR